MTTLNGDYQQLVREFVRQNVHYCVSSLVGYLVKDDSSEYYDEIRDVISSDDWVSPAEEEGWEVLETANGYLFWNAESKLTYDVANGEAVESALNEWDEECYQEDEPTTEDWRSLCNHQNIEAHTNEASEHWIVDQQFAEKLEAKGEMISYDIHGLVVWGRKCTGQEIMLDGVVCQIYDEMMA